MSAVTLDRQPTEAQRRFINSLRAQRALDALGEATFATMTKRDASVEIDRLKALPVVVAQRNAGPLEGIPTSKYAITEDGVMTFWEVKTWQGRTYLRLLVGAPGEFRKVRVGFDRARAVAAAIKVDVLASAQAFARHYTCCAVCGADLSDPVSVDLGLGPICRQRFGL